jgi:CRP/FNR family transcriptional regulator, cyclic AMP receptor protein
VPIQHTAAPTNGRAAAATPPRGFAGILSDEDRAALEGLARRASFPPGTVILHEGVHPESVIVLLEGLVKVTSVAVNGRELVLAVCGPGELIGELAAIDEQPHVGTVVTIGGVTALVISARSFRGFLHERPAAADAVLRCVAGRFRDADRRLVEFGAGDALGRLASRLMELCANHGELSPRGVAIVLPLSQEELAAWAGCSIKAAGNALHTLRELRLIETGRRRITILDPEGLRRLSVVPA